MTQLLDFDNYKKAAHPKESDLSNYFDNQNIVLGEVQGDVEDMKESKADETDLTAHTGNTSNPHSVTAAQIGACDEATVKNYVALLKRNQAYTVGAVAKIATLPNNFYVECITAGTTDLSEPTYTPVVNSVVTDGTAEFKVYRTANAVEVGYLTRSTAYVLGDVCYSLQLKHSMSLVCTQAGTTAGSEPTITNPNMGDVITDGTAKFTIKPTVAEYCTTQPTTESTASPVKPVVCIENYYNSANGDWYRKYSDGFIEQGGITRGSTVNLLCPMSNTHYTISLGQWLNLAQNVALVLVRVISLPTKTTTKFDILYCSENFQWETYVYWTVYGY